MKATALIMAAALAFAGTAHAQTKKITPRGTGGFGAGSSAPADDVEDRRQEGPEQNRSFRRFISGSVSRPVFPLLEYRRRAICPSAPPIPRSCR